MKENEGSFNNEQNKESINLEISPWLRKRLQERTRHLTSSEPWRLIPGASHLVTWVMTHSGLSSLISRVGSMSSLSRALHSIISRTANSESPLSYRMLDLPWFRPGQDIDQDWIDDGSFGPQEIDTGRVTIGSTKSQPQLTPRKSTAKKVVSLSTKSEPYINRLISPPITRKRAAVTVNKIINTSTNRAFTVQNQQTTDTTYLATPSGLQKKLTAYISEQKIETHVYSPIPSIGNVPEVSQINPPQSRDTRNTTTLPTDVGVPLISRHQSRQANAGVTGVQSSGINPAQFQESLPQVTPTIRPAEKKTKRSDTGKSVVDSRQIKQHGTTPANTVLDRINNQPVKNNVGVDSNAPLTRAFSASHEDISLPVKTETKNIVSNNAARSEDTGQLSPSTEKLPPDKLSSTIVKNKPASTSGAYPTKELFYRKPLALGRKIARSIPVIGHITQKLVKNPGISAPVTGSYHTEKQPVAESSQSSTNKVIIEHPEDRDSVMFYKSPDSVPSSFDSVYSPFTAGTTEAEDISLTPVPKKPGPENLLTANVDLKTSTTAQEFTRNRTYQAYPAGDSENLMPPPIGQMSIPALPLITNLSRKTNPPSENNLPANKETREVPVRQLQFGQVESIPEPAVRDTAQLLEPALTETTPAGFEAFPTFTSNGIQIDGETETLPDFTGLSNRKDLDLTLAPVVAASKNQREESNPQLSEVAQHLQSQVFTLPPSTTRDQAQPSQPVSTQAPDVQTANDNTEQNGYKPDIKALAREIYPLIRRMIIIEKERRPSR